MGTQVKLMSKIVQGQPVQGQPVGGGLPPNWQQANDNQGRPYYINYNTNPPATTYTHPSQGAFGASPPPPPHQPAAAAAASRRPGWIAAERVRAVFTARSH